MKRLPLFSATSENVDSVSFFCKQSAPKSEGYRRKRAWLNARYEEGLQIRMLGKRGKRKWFGERGMIEYIPGEFAWRGIDAEEYMVIHCLWVVGKSRGKGGAQSLIQACIDDAKANGFVGIATVCGERGFATTRDFYLKHGFEVAEENEDGLSLLVLRFDRKVSLPTFSSGVKRGPSHYKDGLTIFRSDQCPYLDDATKIIVDSANELGISPIKVIDFKSASTLRKRAPSAYGTFSVVLNGHLLSYRYLSAKEFKKIVSRTRKKSTD